MRYLEGRACSSKPGVVRPGAVYPDVSGVVRSPVNEQGPCFITRNPYLASCRLLSAPVLRGAAAPVLDVLSDFSK